MKKVFIDTNVVLDYYLDREGFSDDAEAILAYGYNQGCSLYVSYLNRKLLALQSKVYIEIDEENIELCVNI